MVYCPSANAVGEHHRWAVSTVQLQVLIVQSLSRPRFFSALFSFGAHVFAAGSWGIFDVTSRLGSIS